MSGKATLETQRRILIQQVAIGLIWVIVLSLCLSAVYRWAQIWAPSAWFGVALTNTLLTILILLMRRGTSDPASSTFGQKYPQSWIVPSLMTVALTFVAVAVSTAVGADASAGTWTVTWEQILWLIWIPVVEEVTYRHGFGRVLRGRFGLFWGGYLSALLFAWVHTLPTLDDLMNLRVGIPFGPFLLGLAAEVIYYHWARLRAVILFHGVCNGTVIIFQNMDRRWLEWLAPLYQH